jgi:hypothetical protein
MHRKQEEFLHLQRGPNSVYEYIKKFNYLMQYGAHHADTHEKKAELFRKGPSAQLQEHLVLFRDTTFNTLVSDAIDQEGASHANLDAEEKKRVMSGPSRGSARGAPPKYCLVYTPPAGQPRRPPPPQWGHCP